MIGILDFGSDIISISPGAFIGRGALGGDFGSAVMAAFVRLSHQHYVHYLTYQCFALHFITFHKPLSASGKKNAGISKQGPTGRAFSIWGLGRVLKKVR